MPDDGEPPDASRGHPAFLLVPDGNPKTAQEWALVLSSQGIPSRSLVRDEVLVLEVPPARLDAARIAIAQFVQENPRLPEPEPEPASGTDEDGPNWVGPIFALAILATFASTGGRELSPELFDRANANAAQILAGQWYRCVTALGLHADIPHVLGNAVIGTYLISAVCRQLGSGLGALLVLSSGAIGNAINAFAYASGHQSVGASTAVFGAIGLLAGVAAVRPPTTRRRRPRWVPFAAGLGLLAMLGTSGARVDIWAHFFGLLAGSLIGAAAGRFGEIQASRRWQWLFGSAAVGLLAECWVVATA